MTRVTINTAECAGCGVCGRYCPAHNIELVDGHAHLKRDTCLGCGHCAGVCARGAIAINGDVPAVAPTGHETLLDVLKSRHSTRFFGGALTHDALRAILDVARYAPSACNARPVRLAVVSRPRLTDAVAALAAAFAARPDCPADFRAVCTRQASTDIICRGAPHVVVAYAPAESWASAEDDAAIVLTPVELAAVSQGYGTLWCGFVKALLSDDAGMAAVGLGGFRCLGCLAIGESATRFVRETPHVVPSVTFIE